MYPNTDGSDNAGLPINVLVCFGSTGSWPIWINTLANSMGCANVEAPTFNSGPCKDSGIGILSVILLDDDTGQDIGS